MGEQIEFGYDYLILAAGVRQSYFGHDEYAAFAPGMPPTLKKITGNVGGVARRRGLATV
jgi:NADH dehydrogenase FAD-containing subunit